MSHKVWLVIASVMILPILFFTVSCAKKGAQTPPLVSAEPEVQKAPDQSSEEADQAARLEEERIQAEAAAREAARASFVSEKVHFAFDSDSLSNQARQVLSGKADFLRSNPDISFTVEGYCDDRGTDAYNIALGQRRADSVKDFLMGEGVGADRMSTTSYGEDRPIAMGQNEAAWAQNRRAQFVIN
jgi:peptidoglycan-associated lipoprotein